VKSTNFEGETTDARLKHIYAMEQLFWHKREVPNPMCVSLEDGDKKYSCSGIKIKYNQLLAFSKEGTS